MLERLAGAGFFAVSIDPWQHGDRSTESLTGLLAWIGCHADSQELAEMFGDDIEFRAATYAIDWRGAPFASLLFRSAGSGRPLPLRVRMS
jgi:hypothetical protein